ncbi:MAG: PEGA domain-containing protein [Deltaproteobacteria bacterium]|nr:PEGA domain-containing protein [Deltaproteobacteria bacterium]
MIASTLLLCAAIAGASVDVVVLPIVGDAAIADELRKSINALPGFKAQPRQVTEEHLASASALGLGCAMDKPACMLQLGGLAGGGVVVGGTLGGTLELQALGITVKSRKTSSTAVPAEPRGRARAVKLAAVRLLAPDRERGSISVNVHQRGATVLVDGVPQGLSPLPGPVEVKTGKHEVYVALIGFESAVEEVTVEFDDVVQVAVRLPPGGTASAPEPAEGAVAERVDDAVEGVPAPNFFAGSERELSIFLVDFQFDLTLQETAVVAAGVVTEALMRHPRLVVIPRDEAMSLVEAQVLSCNLEDDDGSCMSELGRAVGTDLIAFGSISRAGDLIVAAVSVYAANGEPLGRRSIAGSSIDELMGELPKAVHGLMTPIVGPPESRVLTSAGFLGGSVAVVVGVAATVGLIAFATSQDTVANDKNASDLERENARATGLASLIGAGASVALAAGGAVAIGLAFGGE